MLAGSGESHFFTRDVFDRRGIGFEGFDAILEAAVLFVELVDFLLDVLSLPLGTAHGDQSVIAKNILKQQQSKSATQEPI
jgi:hypothetical protein